MVIDRIKGHEIELWDSPEDLPIKKYQKFNKYLMIDNEIGSDYMDYAKRTAKLRAFLDKSMISEAIQEDNNRTQMVFNLMEEYSPKNMALAVMVRRIDNEKIDSSTSSKLEWIVKKLDEIGFSKKHLDEAIEAVKKK